MAKVKIDFSNVEERVLVPEGDYVCKVVKITLKDNQAGDGKLLVWEFVIGLGDYKGNKLYHNTSLKPQALFNLRNTIMALGVDVPKSVQIIDTDKYIGKVVGVTVGHEKYQGKDRARVVDLWRVIKGASGWVRAGQVAKAKVDEEIEEVELDEAPVNGITDEEIEEIEI